MNKSKFCCMFLMVLLSQISFAKDRDVQLKEKWVGLIWQEGEKPIVVPVLKDTEKECLQLVNEMNEITKKTVKIDRNTSCQKVISK